MNTPTPEQLSALIEATRRHRDIAYLANNIEPHHNTGYKFEYSIVSNFYGYPEWLVHFHESLFKNAGKHIPVKLAEAIKPRDNWQSVMHAIQRRIMTEVTLPNAGSSADVVQTVIDLHAQESTDLLAWSAAWSAASSAKTPAMSASGSAAMSARSAASAAERSAARSAAESAAWSAGSEEPAAWKTIMTIVLEEVAR